MAVESGDPWELHAVPGNGWQLEVNYEWEGWEEAKEPLSEEDMNRIAVGGLNEVIHGLSGTATESDE